MRKGEPMGVCKALTITKILFWSGMGLMLLSLAIMSIADDAGAVSYTHLTLPTTSNV